MARTILVAVVACLALASCQVSDVVPEASGEVDPFLEEETEFVQEPTGDVIAQPQACPEGTQRCFDGGCAPVCRGKTGTGGYMEEFKVEPTDIPAPPEVAGTAAAYEQQATNYHAQEDAADYSAITHAEVAQGLADAAQDSKEAERAEEISAEKAKVETEFNVAAAKAATYKEKAHEDDLAILAVKQARITEEEQRKVVAEAKKTLEAEQAKLAMDHQMTLNKQSEEQHSAYAAEWAGEQYTQAKTHAIADDNHLKEQEHETMQEQHYREVARAAVVAEAEREAAAAQAAAAAANPVVPTVKVVPAQKVVDTGSTGTVVKNTTTTTTTIVPATTVSCSDCTTLPPDYSAQGGSCADCPTWAAEGQCTKPAFKLFMTHYCAASCNCSAPAATAVATELLQMPAVREFDDEEED